MPTNNQNLKVLVVEDDATMRDVIKKGIVTHGYQVAEAEDGEMAMQVFEKEKPHAIILDLMLPKMDGFKVLELIRNYPNPDMAATPVVIMSNLWSNKDILSALALRIEAYFVKAHTTVNEVLSKITEVFKKKYSA
jgi:CheY-like chemotaxis protein